MSNEETNHISSADKLFYGKARKATVNNGADFAPRGVRLNGIGYFSLGSPAAASGKVLVKDAAGTGELPNNTTITYTFASDGGSSPLDGTYSDGIIDGVNYGRGVNAVKTATGSDLTITLTGTNYNDETMVETLSIGATGTTAAGAKAFKALTSVALTSTGSMGGAVVSVGVSDVLGLPVRIASKDKVLTFFNGLPDASATIVTGLTTTGTATATNGDVRGTVDTNSALNGSAVSVWIVYPETTTTEEVYGVTEFSG